jgi:hypothetical protein
MSLELVRQVNTQHPQLLRTNLGSTCHEFTIKLIALLRARGHQAFHVCKSPGEGQYVPPGFQPRDVTGLDGRTYRCSGVSHDAIWVDGKQFDTIAQANDREQPIFHQDGSRAGQRMEGIPVWNAIKPEHWRANNPPLPNGIIAPDPNPDPDPVPDPPAPRPSLPDYQALGGDAFFAREVGTPLEQDVQAAGQTLNAGSAMWVARTIHSLIAAFQKHGDHRDAPAVLKRHRNEWRAALGQPPLP